MAEQLPAEALAVYRRARAPVFQLMGIALAEHNLGHARESDAALAELKGSFGHSAAAQIAVAHAWRGDMDRAIAWADRAIRQHDPGLSSEPSLVSAPGS